MNPHINLDLGELIRQIREDKSVCNTASNNQLCPPVRRLREQLAKVLATTRLISGGGLSLPQSRSMALQIERMVQVGLSEKSDCKGRDTPIEPRPWARSIVSSGSKDDELARLSKRELEILTSLASGQSVHEIAALLGRSPKTVNNHRTNILNKLKMRNSAQLTRFAIRNKLIEP